MTCKIILPLFILCTKIAVAQQPAPMETDRPDQTESVALTPKNYFQTEFGFSREQADKHLNSISYPSVLFKYGLSDRLELRFITEIVSERAYGESRRGILPLTLSFKAKLAEEKGIRPATAFIGYLTIPKAGSKNFQSTYYAPAFRFTMQHELSKNISLGYNLGAEWDGETPEPAFIYTLTTGFSLSEKLETYIELYGFLPQLQKPDHRADGGFSYLVTNNMKVDISAGVGISPNVPDFYVAAGFSFRLNTARKNK